MRPSLPYIGNYGSMADIQRIYVRKLNRLKSAAGTFPRLVGGMAVDHYRESFQMGRFNDHISQAWTPRKPNSQRNQGRALLVDTGNLRDSIEVLYMNRNSVRVGSTEAYASIHNYGLMGKAWGKHAFKMPQRQFIGRSAKLEKRISKVLELKMKQALG